MDMKEATGEQQDVAYQVDCPHCEQTDYSDINNKEWGNLEWGDGTPHGVLNCGECGNEFYMTIE